MAFLSQATGEHGQQHGRYPQNKIDRLRFFCILLLSSSSSKRAAGSSHNRLIDMNFNPMHCRLR